jgi:hypothetical protein
MELYTLKESLSGFSGHCALLQSPEGRSVNLRLGLGEEKRIS